MGYAPGTNNMNPIGRATPTADRIPTPSRGQKPLPRRTARQRVRTTLMRSIVRVGR